MICTIKNASTVMYHLFQYELSLFIFHFTKLLKENTEKHKVKPSLCLLVILCVSL